MARVVGVGRPSPRTPSRSATATGSATTCSSWRAAPCPTTSASPGVAEHTFPLKHVDDALALRAHVLSRFERAAADPSLVADGVLDVVVCGGGPTGVEMAGGLHELYRHGAGQGLPAAARSRDARIVARRDGRPPARAVHAESSERARRTLVRPWRRGPSSASASAAVEPGRVHLADGSTIRGRDRRVGDRRHGRAGWRRRSARRPARGGRLVVEPDLSLPGHPEVFAIGDIAASPATDGAPLPQVAQPAIQGGRHVARQILRRLAGPADRAVPLPRQGPDGDDRSPRRGRRAGQRVAAQRARSAGWRGSGCTSLYLIGFRNRIVVVVNWAWNYLTYDRASRILRE